MAKDLQQAVYWYKKAANQGYANAQYNLGALYANGDGVAKDVNQARFWWNKAANQTSDTRAQQMAQRALQRLNQENP